MQKEPAQQRKVIALGHSLAITLPDNWCSQNNVNKGDQVSIYSHEESLSIYPYDKTQESNGIDQVSINSKPQPEQVQTIKPKPKVESLNIEALIKKHLDNKWR